MYRAVGEDIRFRLGEWSRSFGAIDAAEELQGTASRVDGNSESLQFSAVPNAET